jgi:excisionase family DNA binding protein
MSSRVRTTQGLFTASEVARFCQVDLKTIHNWAERGEIKHFRTPGRHLRFQHLDVLDFLRRYGYPVPETLSYGKPRVVLLDADTKTHASVAKVLADTFELRASTDVLSSLIAIGADRPDIVVLESHVERFDALDVVERLKGHDRTKHVRTVVFSADDSKRIATLDAGASAFVPKPDTLKLRQTLEALMGI